MRGVDGTPGSLFVGGVGELPGGSGGGAAYDSGDRACLCVVPAMLTELGRSRYRRDCVGFAEEVLGFSPDAKQAEVLRRPKQFTVLNCSRQWGKSTVAAIRALHVAVTVPKSLVVMGSRVESQSAECLLKVREFADDMGENVRGDRVRKSSLLLPNGSRVVALPGVDKQVRGLSAASLLIIDEAAVVPDAVYHALRPMLATTNGDVLAMSTPRSKYGFFYEAWTHGGEEWHKVMAPASECSRISAEWLKAERAAMGEEMFRREYCCEFTDDEDGLFKAEWLEAARQNDIKPFWGL